MADQKFNFAQTVNLLSQYLKEKRTLQVPTTMNFLTNMEINPATETPNPAKPNSDLFPQFVKNPEAGLADQPGNIGSAQMTIFYGGQVLVFNDLQSEKAREIMGLATKVSLGSGPAAKVVPPESNIVANSQDIQKVQTPQAIGPGDLPIARRASLHKFLAKRKERVATIAPYQLNDHQSAFSSKIDEQMYPSHQAEGQSSKQLELRL